jgi:hypothetical protein
MIKNFMLKPKILSALLFVLSVDVVFAQFGIYTTQVFRTPEPETMKGLIENVLMKWFDMELVDGEFIKGNLAYQFHINYTNGKPSYSKTIFGKRPLNNYVYTYDTSGAFLGLEMFNEDGFQYRNVIEIDTVGRKLSAVSYANDDSKNWLYRYTYNYDDLGILSSMLSETQSEFFIETFLITFEYDDMGRVSKRKTVDNDKILGVTTFEYDSFDNIVTEIQESDWGETHYNFVYKYDEYGNWIEKVTHAYYKRKGETAFTPQIVVGAGLSFVITRDITYSQ